MGPKACTRGLPAAVENTVVMHALPEALRPTGVLRRLGEQGRGDTALVWCQGYPGHQFLPLPFLGNPTRAAATPVM